MQAASSKAVPAIPADVPSSLSMSSSLAQQHTKEAIERIIYWMRADDPRVSLPAAMAVIDRGYGKPAQTVNTNVRRSLSEFTDAELTDIIAGRLGLGV